jgi:hypothetical protein
VIPKSGRRLSDQITLKQDKPSKATSQGVRIAIMVDLDIARNLLTLRFLPPYTDTDERDYLDALVQIGQHDQPFELLTIFGGGGKLSVAGEREQALWFKATRGHISAHCRAVAIVRPGANRKMEETFQKLWPMPLVVLDDETAARAFLAEHRGPA